MDVKGYVKSIITPIVGNIKIHKPLYNYWTPMGDEYPLVYNSEGRPYEFYFIRDVHSAAHPYEDHGKYFIFDRYAYGLKTHFYTHKAMLQTMGNPEKKYGMLVESRNIVPKDYNIFKKHKGLEREFDLIFTFDDQILNDISNARYFPCAAAPFYKNLNDRAYELKEKNISFLCSNKTMCDMHKKRIAAAKYCHSNHLADVYGKAVSEDYVKLEDVLEKYRFSVVIENNVTDYYFSEKITNCFASMVIPIYLGAGKIGDYFNLDGIIIIAEKDLENIETVLKQCTPEEYERRLPAILDNYQRVQEYLNMNDWLYEHYLMGNL